MENWQLLPPYFLEYGLAMQQINSFNHFVQSGIREILNAPSNKIIRTEIDNKFYIEFLDIRIGPPNYEEDMVTSNLVPNICRIRDLTYSAPIYVDVEYTRGSDIIRKQNVEIGRLPVMLKSAICSLEGKSEVELQKLGECPHDPGGYFIIKGSEKVIIIQEQLSKNRILVERDVKHNICATLTSATAESKSRASVVLKGEKIYLRHNSFTDDLPISIIFMAMGMESTQEIAEVIGASQDYPRSVYLSLAPLVSNNIKSVRDALLFIGNRIRSRIMARGFFAPVKEKVAKTESVIIKEAYDILDRVILPHVPMKKSNSRDYSEKITCLVLMIRRVLNCAYKDAPLDDKDHYGNKRLELAGQLVSILFEDLYKKFLFQVKKQVEQSLERYIQSRSSGSDTSYPDTFRNLPNDIITRGMQSSISTGNWSIKRFKMERSGVTQILSRLNYMATIGMMMRINSQFEKGRKVSGPRALSPSQWGFICPCDTPEGESCGLVKNLALATHVTNDENPQYLERLLYSLGLFPSKYIATRDLFGPNNWLVFLNGLLVGVHSNAELLMNSIKRLRRAGKIGEFVSIYSDDSSVYISSDGGRVCRPLIIVESGKSRLTKEILEQVNTNRVKLNQLLKDGVLEWIDVNEENNLLIATKPDEIVEKTTHLELDPFTILGIISGLIPYPHHNQSPRNTYQCGMGKQAIGCVGYNQFSRCDTMLHVLVYPQKPLISTRTLKLTAFEQLPAGQNAIVAVMSYGGYEIEDAIVINKASVDRGFGRCITMKRMSVELKKYHSGNSDIAAPVAQLASNINYQDIESDGIVRVGHELLNDQIIVSKISQGQKITPVKYKQNISSHLDRVIVTDTMSGCRVYKMILRKLKPPELGDKFSSRHGQKGVVGLIANQEDLPFSSSGWVPDLIMNPHGFPSRMTVGKLLELVASKATVCTGVELDGTAFTDPKVDEIRKTLLKHGFNPSGKELLYSGISGEAIETFIFTGPIYYQKLKHMVQDKIHARGRGPRQLLTRQPTEGRSKDGGLRLGEMERDCLISYGTSNLILERLMLSSDVCKVMVCNKCGLMGYKADCLYCKLSNSCVPIQMPYACKLLFHELQTMNIAPRIVLNTSNDI